MSTNGKKVLLVRLSSLGDVIFNIPLANCLKANGYNVTWLVSEKGYSVINNNSCVDKVILVPIEKWKKEKNIFNRISETFKIIEQLKKENFDIAIDTQMILKSAFWTLFSGAKRRIIAENYREFANFSATEIIPSTRKDFSEHAVLGYMKFAEYLGLNTQQINVTLPESTNACKLKVDKLLEKINKDKPLLVIAPATTWTGKHWKKEKWKNLIPMLEKDYNIIFTGNESDKELIEELRDNYFLSLAGKTSLEELIEVLRRTDILISLDSGTTHLAWATQQPKIVSIFCCTPKTLYAPLGSSQKYIGLSGSLYCQPCHHKKCYAMEQYACTNLPETEEVYYAVKKLMGG